MLKKLLALFYLTGCASLLHASTVTIATGDYAPWAGRDLPYNGYVNHIVSEAFAAVGIQVKFVFLPWKRAYRDTRNGLYDATSYWYRNEERSRDMWLSNPVIHNRTVFFQRSSDKDIQWQTIDDLTPYRIGATVGFTYPQTLQTAIDNKQLRATVVPNEIQNIKMLVAGRVDIIVTDESTGFTMAERIGLPPAQIKVIEPELAEVDGYLMASRTKAGSPKLIAQFNEGLRIIKANGKYQEIVASLSHFHVSTANQNSSVQNSRKPGQ